MRDLLVTVHTPALGSGRALRTYGIARALAAHGGLDLLYARFESPHPDAAFRAIPGIELHAVVPSRGARRLLAYGAARVHSTPAAIARGVSPELAAETAILAATPGRGRVIADGPVTAAALRRVMRERPVIYNAHNFESGFRHELDGAGAMGSPRALRAFERGLLAEAHESWMASEADLAAARELCPSARLRYVPNVVDVAAIDPIESTPPEQRAIFVANFAYEPNRNGLRFLLAEVLPRVWAQLPDAKLALVGAGLDEPLGGDSGGPLDRAALADSAHGAITGLEPERGVLTRGTAQADSAHGAITGLEPERGALTRGTAQADSAHGAVTGRRQHGLFLREWPSPDPRVEVLGFVEDLRTAYLEARCAVVPLLQGGGTPLKLIEALAYGLPVIATPRAVAGLAVRDGEHCLIADGAEAFAQALIRVLRDGAPELARNGRELAAERYSIEALSELLAPPAPE